MRHLGKVFEQHFEIVRADTPVLLDEALRLRYQVYCKETGYERQANFPDGIEFDQYDLFSMHAIIRHRKTGNLAANTRLILPRSNKSDFHFPMQELVSDEQIQRVVRFSSSNMGQFAEISRFCVSRYFKHRFNEAETIAGVDDPGKTDNSDANVDVGWQGRTTAHIADAQASSNGRLIPHITIALFAAIYEMSADEGIKHWFAVMEPSLLRFLSRYGIDFTPIGDPLDHRGLRQPCYANAEEMSASMWSKRPDIWRFVTRNGEMSQLKPDDPNEMASYNASEQG